MLTPVWRTPRAEILDLEALGSSGLEDRSTRARPSVPPLGLLFAYLYATLHYIVTPAVLVWIAVRRRDGYRPARNALLAATAIGLVGYWLLPTAPPRLLDAGFTDTMATFSGVGWWGDAASAPRGMEALSNQYAALPSLHVGWAVWVALCLSPAQPQLAARTLGVGLSRADDRRRDGHRQPLPHRRSCRHRLRRLRQLARHGSLTGDSLCRPARTEPREDLVSTIEPPPRPAATARGTTPGWTRIVPCIQGGELVVRRSSRPPCWGCRPRGQLLGARCRTWALAAGHPGHARR